MERCPWSRSASRPSSVPNKLFSQQKSRARDERRRDMTISRASGSNSTRPAMKYGSYSKSARFSVEREAGKRLMCASGSGGHSPLLSPSSLSHLPRRPERLVRLSLTRLVVRSILRRTASARDPSLTGLAWRSTGKTEPNDTIVTFDQAFVYSQTIVRRQKTRPETRIPARATGTHVSDHNKQFNLI